MQRYPLVRQLRTSSAILEFVPEAFIVWSAEKGFFKQT
jgi:hypothetical protein